MSNFKVEFKGFEPLHDKLAEMKRLEAAKAIVTKNTAQLDGLMKSKASFRGGYTRGATRRSILMDITDGGLTGKVGPTVHYALYLEYGTRFMSAQPFIGPAFNIQKMIFLADLKRLV